MFKFIGVDLHKNNFTACFYRQGKYSFGKFPVSEVGLAQFLSKVNPKDHIALETVGNSRFFQKSVEPYVSSVSLVPTSAFSVIRQSTKKTDMNDAALIAFFLSKNMLPVARPKSDLHMHLLSIIKLRQHMMIVDNRFLNILNGFLSSEGIIVPKQKLKTKSGFAKYTTAKDWDEISKIEIDNIKDIHIVLKEKIAHLETEIGKYSQSLVGYEELLSISGIGHLSAPIFLCSIGDIRNFASPSKLASYFGIVPSVRISNGKKEFGRMTKRGSKLARTALIQCAWVRIKVNKKSKKLYEHHKKKKGAKRAIVVCARELLNIIYATLMEKSQAVAKAKSKKRVTLASVSRVQPISSTISKKRVPATKTRGMLSHARKTAPRPG